VLAKLPFPTSLLDFMRFFPFNAFQSLLGIGTATELTTTPSSTTLGTAQNRRGEEPLGTNRISMLGTSNQTNQTDQMNQIHPAGLAATASTHAGKAGLVRKARRGQIGSHRVWPVSLVPLVSLDSLFVYSRFTLLRVHSCWIGVQVSGLVLPAFRRGMCFIARSMT